MTEDSTQNYNKWLGLLKSRKVWIALLAFVVGIIGYIEGSVSLDQLATLGVALGTAIVIGIAVEDHGLRSSGR